MKIRNLFLSASLLSICWPAFSQTTKEEMLSDLDKTASVYYAYPVKESHNTPAPKGYKPVYISHFGRHGSRYLISTADYTRLRDIFHKAKDSDALTPLGEDVMLRIDSVLIEADGRGGDLAPLGVRQHRDIAERMFKAYPEVFKGNTPISARSTLVVRCVLSMDAFCERLKELNPGLNITRESSQRYMPYLCYWSPESGEKDKSLAEEKRKFEEKMTRPDRLLSSLFSDPEFVRKNVNPHDFMWGLYYLASGMQDIETDLSFYDIFTPEELFDLWQAFNFRFYTSAGNFPGNDGLMIDNAKYLLQNFIDSADEALASDSPSATLRFGHDNDLIRFAGILEFENAVGQEADPDKAYEAFADYKIAPMAGNVQLVFFSNPKDKSAPVLVKFMLNEEEQRLPIPTDSWPFYRWDDVKAFYSPKLP